VLHKRRWQVVAVPFTAGVITDMDHGAVSILFSAFFTGYAVFNVRRSLISNRIGGYRAFTTAFGVWSMFCAATATTTEFISLLTIRIFFWGDVPLGCSHGETVIPMSFVSGGIPPGDERIPA
jgi:hypothetical protein